MSNVTSVFVRGRRRRTKEREAAVDCERQVHTPRSRIRGLGTNEVDDV